MLKFARTAKFGQIRRSARRYYQTRPSRIDQYDIHASDPIAIDRSDLPRPTESKLDSTLKGTKLQQHLTTLIQVRGPLTVASFMREVLLNPLHGYYMNRDVFGSRGDFITSPEVSQVFGELFGLWCVETWRLMGEPKKFNLIEFGPGRGTLMNDMLKAIKKFPSLYNSLSITFVEMSPFLRTLQAKALGAEYPEIQYKVGNKTGLKLPTDLQAQGDPAIIPDLFPSETNPPTPDQPPKAQTDQPDTQTTGTAVIQDTDIVLENGVKVSWRQQLADVTPGPCIIIAHEFFDALSVHQFKYTAKGWRELLVDVNHSGEGKNLFNFHIAPGHTLASTALLAHHKHIGFTPKEGDTIEVSGESMAVAQQMGEWITANKGAALIVDYGYNHPSSISLRAIQGHQFIDDILEDPGSSDLSCNVDFSALSQAARTVKTPQGASLNDSIVVHGPVTQRDFLFELGIECRIATLLQHTTNEQTATRHIQDLERLTDNQQMGQIYKVMAIGHKDLPCPPGFYFPTTKE